MILKKILLLILSISITTASILQWDMGIIKASEEQINSLALKVNGIPSTWTNKPISLTIEKNDKDFMYSFSKQDGIYQWQKDNHSKPIGENGKVYVAVMDENGNIKENIIEINKLDLYHPIVDVNVETSNTKTTFSVNASDSLSGIKEYSFDNGDTWQSSNIYETNQHEEVQILVKDYAGNIKAYEKNFVINTRRKPRSLLWG